MSHRFTALGSRTANSDRRDFRSVILVAAHCLAALCVSGVCANTVVTIDSGGQRATSLNYTMNGSVGGVVGISTAADYAMRHGYIGQLFEVTSLVVTAIPASVTGGATSQLHGTAALDDGTRTVLDGGDIQWTSFTFPIQSIDTSGLVAVALVGSNSVANFSGAYFGIVGFGSLLVTHVNAPPRVSIAPVAPVTLPVATVNLDGTVTDDGAPFGSVSTMWSKVSGSGTVIFGNANAIDTSATVSTNGAYVLRLTASDGALSASNDVTVIVNAHPTITSQPTVTNQLATVGGHPVVLPGEPVAFSSGATGSGGNPLSCLWDFGDGQTSVDCDPSHVFSNCGPIEVTAIVSDGVAPVTNILLVSVACPFSELPKPTSLKMKSNFAPGKLDSSTLKTSVDMPPGFSAPNTPVTLELAGIEIPFTLNAKRQGANAFSSIKFSHKGTGTLWQVSAKLKGDFDVAWQNAGLTNATVTALPITVPILLLFDTPAPESFYMEKPLLYKATAGKSGSAK